MPPFPAQDRLVRKEVALGTLREIEPPKQHIGTRVLAPFLDVASDDVIFDYARGLTDGLAPARAEDAESDLAQKDLAYGGVGRASVIDWALKDHYDASDVTRYRETLLLRQQAGTNQPFNLTIDAPLEEFRRKVARDDALRRRKLDNRIEWMITQALETGGIAYNDGKIKFAVDFGRPAGQTDEAPAGGLWSATTSDPIGDLLAVDQLMYDTYGVHLGRAITSRRVLNNILNSDRFIARSGIALPSGGSGGSPASGTIDPNYIIDGWGPNAAQQIVERVTGIQFIEYDAVYRTRPVGSNTVTNNRFLSDNKVYLLPRTEDLDELDDTEIGFARTLTSPHMEGNMQSGFYEWERDTVDPWGTDRGTGIKAFPVFLHMDLTYTMTVLA
jgi:hypothetical protein